jgi:hypothetical protein
MLRLIEPTTTPSRADDLELVDGCHDLLERWEVAQPMLTPAIERLGGTHLAVDVLKGIVDGTMQLWVYWKDGEVEAACVTRITQGCGYVVCSSSAARRERTG